MLKHFKVTGLTAFVLFAGLSGSALGADDPAQRFVDRLAGVEISASAPTAAADPSNPAQAFLDRLAGWSAPTSPVAETASSGDAATAFVNRLAGIQPIPEAKTADLKLASNEAGTLASGR